MQSFTGQLVPGMRQSLEEVLVDTAHVLAEVVAEEVQSGTVATGRFANQMQAFSEKNIDAVIWFMKKRDPSLVVYITDAQGRVLYDSRGRDVGADYSRWNDVYLTLRGQYGARTTREIDGDEFSAVMYVAAPVIFQDDIIGVLTVGKPSITVQPFVDAAVKNIESKGVLVISIALVVGLILAYWLTLSIRRLTDYALAVREGRRVEMPMLREKELDQLASAMEAMRRELEGKDYVEDYLHSLTHELKSPLAAIRGAAELLDESMSETQRQQFINNIRNESERLSQVVERLLDLAALEKRTALEKSERVSLKQLGEKLCHDKLPIFTAKMLTVRCEIPENCVISGEAFLLQQALSNLIDNAVEFSADEGGIEIIAALNDANWEIVVRDHGPGIPEYALPRIFERFYSLPRSQSKRKSTGLGLSFVREVAELHQGQVTVTNHIKGGAEAKWILPAEKHT